MTFGCCTLTFTCIEFPNKLKLIVLKPSLARRIIIPVRTSPKLYKLQTGIHTQTNDSTHRPDNTDDKIWCFPGVEERRLLWMLRNGTLHSGDGCGLGSASCLGSTACLFLYAPTLTDSQQGVSRATAGPLQGIQSPRHSP